jgi:membrane associated rhomboid family serine protease
MKVLRMIRKPFRYSFTNITLWLIGINVLMYFLTIAFPELFHLLMLNPPETLGLGYFWQPFTYMFLHNIYNFNITHLLFNMFGLFVFGLPLERQLGSKEFLLFYLFTGTATGILTLLIGIPVVGASGAIFGLVLGFATYYPDTTLLIGFFIPVKARIAVILFVVGSLVLHFFDSYTRISHLAHLGGILFAFIYFIVRLQINPLTILFRR